MDFGRMREAASIPGVRMSCMGEGASFILKDTIVVVLPCRVMRTAVELDDERGVIAEEIDNIRPDGSLLPEADGVGFEEVVPKMALGGSHVAAEGTGTRLGRRPIGGIRHRRFLFLLFRPPQEGAVERSETGGVVGCWSRANHMKIS